MRKIISKQLAEKKRQVAIALIFVGLMILSVVGYSFKENDNEGDEMNYNGFKFVKQNGFWMTGVGGLTLAVSYNPLEVEEVQGSFNDIESYSGKPLYISSENYDAELEIYRNLDQIILRRQYACLEGRECENKEFPVKTCGDNFIIIEGKNSTNIKQEDNCVFIAGEGEELIKTTDAYLFKLTGIQ